MSHRVAPALYEPLDRVLVRAPLLPVEAYLALAADDADPRLMLGDPRVRSALDVGSPDLLAELERAGSDTRAERLGGKLLRYVIRMSTRPTPYGLFAGVALARLGDCTDLRVGAGGPHTRTRPDMGWLLAFVAQLEQRPEVRRELRVVTNPAVWMHAGRAHLAERTAVDGSGDASSVGIRATEVVRRVIRLARAPIAWSRLADELLVTADATRDKVDGLLTQLWEQTFLLTELRPPLTHAAPSRHVAARLATVPAAAAERAAFVELLDAMAAWDELAPGERPAARRALARRAAAAVPGHRGAHVQVDTALALDGHGIAAPVGRAVARAAELLLRLATPSDPGPLEGYYRAFLDRYGDDREVPLCELLDRDHGLGPPSDHAGPARGASSSDRAVATLRSIALGALRDRRFAVQLDEATIARLASASPTPATAPVSLDLAVFVLAASAADVDAGNFRLLVGPNVGAPAAGRNLGRFADLLGGEAIDVLSAIAAAESACNPADVPAELVYLPRHGRAANVAIRPPIHEHEVVVATTPGVEPQRAIPLAELLVGVRDGRFYVRWPRLPGDLHVHAGHMLNPHSAPAACRFLADVAHGERVRLRSFDWGPASDLPFLPRIESDEVVLAQARWRIDAPARDASLPTDSEKFAENLARWRAVWMVPRRVYLAQADNRLLLDLEAPAQAEQLRRELARLGERDAVVLQEPLPGPEHAWLSGPDGQYLCELIVPLVQRATASANAVRATVGASAAIALADRLRPPGSNWLYAKLYGPREGADELLAGPVRDFGQFATGSGLAERWFFVRYADPHPHLRVRFGGDPDRLVHGLLPALCDFGRELLGDGSCARVSFDTYEREIERYGGLAAMAIAEAIFAADSAAVVELLRLARGDLPTVDRTALAVVSVDALLGGLGLDPPSRLAWYRGRVAAKHETGTEYRRRQDTLRRLLSDADACEAELGGPAVTQVLRALDAALEPLARRLLTVERDGELTKPVGRISESFIHLHLNRLLGSGGPGEQHVLGLLMRTREGLARAPVTVSKPTRSG